MLSKSFCQQAASCVLAATLAFPQFGFAATAEGPTVKLIFPGQALPKELGFSPLKVGSTGDAEVQITARDWFLLKDKNLAMLNPVVGKTLDVVGPVLDSNNGQIYFRLISGMILKESMVQMGMNAGQARRFIERAGADFDTAPLEKLGELPKGLVYLFENWDRTAVKMALIPNILLPLAVAHDQSQFMHFAKAQVEDQEAQKTCSAISTVAPIGPVQTKITEKQKQMESINTELRNATSRLALSTAEQVRLNGIVKDISGTIDAHMQCFDVIKNRTSRGGTMPDGACLNLAAAAMTEAKLQAEWTRFTANNLKNDQGDETVKKQMETEVRALEARVAETQAIVRSLQVQQDKANQEQVTASEKLKKLNEVFGPEKSKEADLEKEQQALKAELLTLQTRDYKLKTGTLKSELSEEEVKAAIAAIPESEKRMAAIDLRSKQIVPEQVKRQAYQASILTQIQAVTAGIDSRTAQLATLEVQLNDKATGYNTKLAALQAELAVLTPKFIKISDEAVFSEYVVSILMRKLTTMGQSRDAQFNAVKAEEARAEKYKLEIAAASKDKDSRYDSIQAEVTSLEALIASYRDVAQMGWFLETDCAARANFSGQQPGVYISRAKVTDVITKTLPTTPVDGGHWGLFNLDFAHFQAPIQSGILLNVPGYIQMAVQQILANYDFAATQILDPAVSKCADIESARGSSAAVLGMMRTASLIWTEGSGDDAKVKAFQCRSTAATAPTILSVPGKKNVAPVAQPPRAVTTPFSSSLARLIAFDGSVLDAALPKAGQSHPVDLIERQAIALAGRELALLGGTLRANGNIAESHIRRDEVIKALLRVLAFDYEAEMNNQTAVSTAQNRYQYVFATAAPGKTVAADGGLTAGQIYTIKTIGAVPLYSLPKKGAETSVALSLNDQVRVVSPDQEPGLVRAGWIKVQSGTQEYWMPAWPLASNSILDDSGREIQGVTELQNCANPRVVLNFTNFNTNKLTVPRFSTNVKTRMTYKKSGIFTIDETLTPTVESAYLNKTYISCGEPLIVEGQAAMTDVPAEFLSKNGVDYSKAQAIRIVEVKALQARNGQVIYIPQESTGGYVQTWTPKGKGMAVRLVLGAEIDPATWSLRK